MDSLAPFRPGGNREAVCPLATDAATLGVERNGFDLGAVLARHDDEITRLWAFELNALRRRDGQDVALDETWRLCDAGLATLIECMRTRSPGHVADRLDRWTASPVNDGLCPCEVVENWLLLQEAALPQLLARCAPDPGSVGRCANQLARCVRCIASRLCARAAARHNGEPHQILCAILDVLRSPSLPSRPTARGLVGGHPVLPSAPPVLYDLTERESDVLREMARGLSNREIGETLHISSATVRTHVTHILSKLHVTRRTQAVLYALRHGLAPIDSDANEA